MTGSAEWVHSSIIIIFLLLLEEEENILCNNKKSRQDVSSFVAFLAVEAVFYLILIVSCSREKVDDL